MTLYYFQEPLPNLFVFRLIYVKYSLPGFCFTMSLPLLLTYSFVHSLFSFVFLCTYLYNSRFLSYNPVFKFVKFLSYKNYYFPVRYFFIDISTLHTSLVRCSVSENLYVPFKLNFFFFFFVSLLGFVVRSLKHLICLFSSYL